MEEAVAAASAAASAAKDALEAPATAKEASVARAAAASAGAEEAAAAASAATEAAVAAMSACKRRKIDRIDYQKPPASGHRGEEGSLDLVSRLPDAILGAIISLLPTKDGVRTQAISRRWLPLWRCAPLNLLTNYNLGNDSAHRHAIVSKILSEHPGPGRCFSFHSIDSDSYSNMDGWFRSQALDNLQELEVMYQNYDDNNMRYPLPLSALRFAPTLRVAKFGTCDFPNLIAPQSINFPNLKQLDLFGVTISEGALHAMLSSCPVLESLSLHNNIGIDLLCISSPTLRSISWDAPRGPEGVITFQELVIEDAPCLERFLPLYPDDGPAIRIIRAPRLEMLGYLSERISKLHFGTTVFQKMIAVSLTSKMHTMRILGLNSIVPNLDAVVDFLKCFPCLEKLYVILRPRKDMNNVRMYDPVEPIECLELHLKKVVLKNYDGSKKPFVEFAKFFVLNAISAEGNGNRTP